MEKTPLTRFPQAHKLPKTVKADFVAKIRAALDANPAAVERAIKVLFDRQTAGEKAVHATLEDNSLGVRHNHGGKVVYYGKWLASGRHLTGTHLEKARKLAHTYAATQLFELAALKAGLIKVEVAS